MEGDSEHCDCARHREAPLQDSRLQAEAASASAKKHLVLILTASALKLVLMTLRNSLKVLSTEKRKYVTVQL